jgi:hypothetical protein
VRRIGGLPHLTDVQTLGKIVREGAIRFFLRSDSPLLTTGVWIIEPGCVCGAAIDEATVRAVVKGCTSARTQLRALIPAAAVIGYSLVGDELCWVDGAVEIQVTLERGKVRSVRRIAKGLLFDHEALRPRQPLKAIGDGAWRYADAYGATFLPRHEPLSLRPGKDTTEPSRTPRWRIVAAASAALIAVAGAMSARPFAAARARNDAEKALAGLVGSYRTALADRAALERIVAVLKQVADFERNRNSATLLMGALTRTLPEQTALTVVRLDSIGGTIVTLGPSAADVMTTIESAAGIVGPEMVGPITQEVTAGAKLERVTVRFRFAKESVPPLSTSIVNRRAP